MSTLRVFFLDLISNSLGAMLFIFVLVSSRNSVVQPPRDSAALMVQATADDEGAEIGIWVKPPQQSRRLFSEELMAPDAVALLEPGRPASAPMDGGAYLYLQSAERRPSAVIKIDRPRIGCWQFGAYYVGHEDLLADVDIATRVRMRAWLRRIVAATPGAIPDDDRASVFPLPQSEVAAPTADVSFAIAVPGGTPCDPAAR